MDILGCSLNLKEEEAHRRQSQDKCFFKMSKPQLLTVFIAKRLISAAVNIFGIEERRIAQYQEPLAAVTVEIMAAVETTIEQELSSSKQEIERLRRLLLELGAGS